jgi:sensor histidine kinase YesM
MNNRNLQLVHGNIHKTLLFNGVLWICSFTILLFIFSENSSPKKIDFIYTGSFLLTILVPVLLNLYILIPLFLKTEKYLLFVITFVLTIIIFTQLNIWFFDYFIDYLFPDYFFISYHSNSKLITIFSIFLLGTTLIKLSIDWFYFNKQENLELKLKNQQIELQLKLLRSQINPHFLFNSLNVIYALAIGKKEETKDAIVQLSDILRYVIYDSNTTRVALKDEITLLKNYIDFQQFRYLDTGNVSFNFSIRNHDYQIYPMLLLPLVENSFKYGIKGDINNTFINITLTQKDNLFSFCIENNFSENEMEANGYSGLGNKNLKKNLEIIYPNQHEFKIYKKEKTFTVNLKIFQK